MKTIIVAIISSLFLITSVSAERYRSINGKNFSARYYNHKKVVTLRKGKLKYTLDSRCRAKLSKLAPRMKRDVWRSYGRGHWGWSNAGWFIKIRNKGIIRFRADSPNIKNSGKCQR